MSAPEITGNRLGLIIGSGLPSGSLAGSDQVLVLERHGKGHRTAAHLVDHHDNVRRLCEAGCARVIAISSVGSLRVDWPVGTLVCPDDFYAPHAAPTFFDGPEGHLVPGFDFDLRKRLIAAWGASTGPPLLSEGVYAQTSGPRFETPTEVRALAKEADVVGMTIASEAILAGEAGLAYAAICAVDNLANGLAAERLTLAELEAARERNAVALLAVLPSLLKDLAA